MIFAHVKDGCDQLMALTFFSVLVSDPTENLLKESKATTWGPINTGVQKGKNGLDAQKARIQTFLHQKCSKIINIKQSGLLVKCFDAHLCYFKQLNFNLE